jgi:hypothetical protein
MPVITLPHPRSVQNAPTNGDALAVMMRDSLNPPVFVGPHPAGGDSCTMCGRTPPSDMLYKIIVNTVTDGFVLIGIDVCTTEHLVKAIENLLVAERAGTHRHGASRIRRLENALAAIDR